MVSEYSVQRDRRSGRQTKTTRILQRFTSTASFVESLSGICGPTRWVMKNVVIVNCISGYRFIDTLTEFDQVVNAEAEGVVEKSSPQRVATGENDERRGGGE